MGEFRKALSNVVSELILVLITVFLATVVYAWVSSTFALLGTGVLPPMARISSVSLAYATLVTSPNQQYSYGYYVLVTLDNPKETLTLESVQVYSGSALICSSDKFVESADDVGLNNGKALGFAGYYGNKSMVLDDEDSVQPGLIALTLAPKGDTINNVGNSSLHVTYFFPVDEYTSEQANSWASIFAGVVQRHLVGYLKTETYLSKAPGSISFKGLVGRTKTFFNDTSGEWVYVNSYERVVLGRGTYTLVIWCKNLNLVQMSSLKIVIRTDSYIVSKTVNLVESI